MIVILFFLYVSYLILAFNYTVEALLNKEACRKYWYLTPLAIIWCILISWIYFPYDLGPKLCKKYK